MVHFLEIKGLKRSNFSKKIDQKGQIHVQIIKRNLSKSSPNGQIFQKNGHLVLFLLKKWSFRTKNRSNCPEKWSFRALFRTIY